jgi:hypothetical protein
MNSENGMSCGCSRDMNGVIPNRYYNSQENWYQYILWIIHGILDDISVSAIT